MKLEVYSGAVQVSKTYYGQVLKLSYNRIVFMSTILIVNIWDSPVLLFQIKSDQPQQQIPIDIRQEA